MRRDELLKVAKPILFNTEMVRATQNGTKTATRRAIRPQPKSKLSYIFAGKGVGKWSYPGKNAYKSWGDEFKLPLNISDEDLKKYWTAPYHADDILYVRETFAELKDINGNKRFVYKSTDKYPFGEKYIVKFKWNPSIHMPKEAARIFLRVTNVRLERLQDIRYEDCLAEGVQLTFLQQRDLTKRGLIAWNRFSVVWDSTIKKSDLSKYGWNANPWVWVIEFERISREEAYNA